MLAASGIAGGSGLIGAACVIPQKAKYIRLDAKIEQAIRLIAILLEQRALANQPCKNGTVPHSRGSLRVAASPLPWSIEDTNSKAAGVSGRRLCLGSKSYSSAS